MFRFNNFISKSVTIIYFLSKCNIIIAQEELLSFLIDITLQNNSFFGKVPTTFWNSQASQGENPDFTYILWLFNIFNDPTTTISGTILYLKDRLSIGEDTKNTIHTLWPCIITYKRIIIIQHNVDSSEFTVQFRVH